MFCPSQAGIVARDPFKITLAVDIYFLVFYSIQIIPECVLVYVLSMLSGHLELQHFVRPATIIPTNSWLLTQPRYNIDFDFCTHVCIIHSKMLLAG